MDLVQYQSVASVTEHWDNWEKVVEKFRTGQMPPKVTSFLNTQCRWIHAEMSAQVSVVRSVNYGEEHLPPASLPCGEP